MLLLEAALAELIRLYDWRFELARMEAAVKAGNFLLAPDVKRFLRQYGEEKKAAWEVARAVLRGGATASVPATITTTIPVEKWGPDNNCGGGAE